MNGSRLEQPQGRAASPSPDRAPTKVTLGDWGQLTIGSAGRRHAARPTARKGYRGFVTELDVHLTADHGGLPAGSEIQIGYAEAAAQTAPPAAPPRHDARRPTRCP